MDKKTFLDNFDVIADSPNGIANVRTLLVDLAIQGQLLGKQELRENGYPNEWDVANFRELCNIEGGNQPPKSTFVSEPRPGYVQLFQIRDLGSNPVPVFIPEQLAKSTAADGDILIGRYGASVGKVFRAQQGAYNVALVKFTYPKDRLNADFIFWILKSSPSQALFTGMTRSAQAGFNKRDLAPLRIPIPSLDEQVRIVSRINELMSLCDELEAEKAKQEVLRSAARDSAIDAISTATTPEELSTAWSLISNNWATFANFPSGIQRLRALILDIATTGQLISSANKEVQSVSIDEICDYVQRGRSPKYSASGSVKVVSQKCVQWNGFDPSLSRIISNDSISGYKEERFLRDGDLLWNSTGTGTLGRTALFESDGSDIRYVADSHVTILRSPKVEPKYLQIWSASPSIQALVLGSATGSTNQQELNLTSVKALKIDLPSREVQKQIVAKVDELMALCDELEVNLNLRTEIESAFAGALSQLQTV